MNPKANFSTPLLFRMASKSIFLMKLIVLKKFDTIRPCIRILKMIDGRNSNKIIVLLSSECIKIEKDSLHPSFVSTLNMYSKDSKMLEKDNVYWKLSFMSTPLSRISGEFLFRHR